jgi:hypothetical protein
MSKNDLMRQTPTETAPRTGPYESTLPPEALHELLRRRGSEKTVRRSRILGRKKAANSRQGMPAFWGVVALFLIVALIGFGSWFSSSLSPATPPQAVVEPVRSVQPVPQAQQVLRVGVWSLVYMPDGKLTMIRFLGIKNTFADLPKNPQLGDSYGVLEGGQGALWVWYTLPGHVAPAWVDP